MEDGASLPLALHQLESAIDDEADPSVLRAVRQRLMERLTARINELEEFSVTLLRPSGDSRTLSGCLPDDLLEALREKAAREFGIPRDALVLCRGSRQFAVKELRMSLADVGVGQEPRVEGRLNRRFHVRTSRKATFLLERG
ncbi:unnamed protein product [Effrenium voratum]|nr:unnamed protein product [Effrenium voratum]